MGSALISRPSATCKRKAVADRWPPTTRADLELALTNGLLEEGHFPDLKRELPPAGRNAGIAADLAAFSVDGGAICFGLDESTFPPTITPTPLKAAAERIEQVGLASVDPPVRVRSHRIEMEPSGHGVLVVVVPPSANAPHMGSCVHGPTPGTGRGCALRWHFLWFPTSTSLSLLRSSSAVWPPLPLGSGRGGTGESAARSSLS